MTRRTRRRFTLTALLCTLITAGVASCGKRSRIPAAIDGAAKLDGRPRPPIKLDTSVRRDRGSVQNDYFVPPPPDLGPLGPKNSGAICSLDTSCASSSDVCLALDPAATTGMCLGMCSSTGSDCPVANPSTQLSKCVLKARNNLQLYCAWFCEQQGKSYKCPNNTNYKCVAMAPQQPSIKFCMPK